MLILKSYYGVRCKALAVPCLIFSFVIIDGLWLHVLPIAAYPSARWREVLSGAIGLTIFLYWIIRLYPFPFRVKLDEGGITLNHDYEAKPVWSVEWKHLNDVQFRGPFGPLPPGLVLTRADGMRYALFKRHFKQQDFAALSGTIKSYADRETSRRSDPV
jgi:hypothetical protein